MGTTRRRRAVHVQYRRDLGGEEWNHPLSSGLFLLYPHTMNLSRTTLLVLALLPLCCCSVVDRNTGEQPEDPNARDKQGRTPLIRALSNHYPYIFGGRPSYSRIKRLIEAGADLNATDNQGWTALHHAVMSDSADLIGMAPEFYNRKIIMLLVDRGSDLRARTDKGDTPLDLIRKYGHNIEMARYLANRMGIADFDAGKFQGEVFEEPGDSPPGRCEQPGKDLQETTQE